MEKVSLKRQRYQQSRDVVAFLLILRCVFPEFTKNDNPQIWEWKNLNTRKGKGSTILILMKLYHETDENGYVFRRWDFNAEKRMQQCRLGAYIHSIKRSFALNN